MSQPSDLSYLSAHGNSDLQLGWELLLERVWQDLHRAMLANSTLDCSELRKRLVTWQVFINNPAAGERVRERRQREFARVELLIDCVEAAQEIVAKKQSSSTLAHNEIDAILCSIRPDVSNRRKRHVGWSIEAIRQLLGDARSHVVRQIRVPVALGQDAMFASGALGFLELSLLRPGQDDVFQMPADSLRSYASPDFEGSMQGAWSAARSLALDGDEAGSLYDACWRLILPDSEPVDEVRGPSAGGAAAWGWSHLLSSTPSDARIIVLATVDAQGRLGAVDSVKEKTLAILEHSGQNPDWTHRIDTIVVADGTNAADAKAVLEEKRGQGRIQVIDLSREHERDKLHQ